MTGTVAVQLLRVVMGLLLSFAADKPQYGALTLPIGILFVLYLNSMAIFGVAALTAAIAERDVPIDQIAPGIDLEDAQPDIETDCAPPPDPSSS